MMVSKFTILIRLLVLLWVNACVYLMSAFANTEIGRILWIIGFGLISCYQFLESLNQKELKNYVKTI